MKKIILSSFVALLLLNGCKPKETIQYIDRYHETVKIDSVYQYLKDTVTIAQRGDTIFVTNYKTKIDYKFKYLTKIDTLSQITTEYKTKIEYKEKKVTNWISYVDWIVIVLLLLYFVFRLLKFLKII